MSDTKRQSHLIFFFCHHFARTSPHGVLKETETALREGGRYGKTQWFRVSCKKKKKKRCRRSTRSCGADSCDRTVTRGDALPPEETEHCHNVHLKHSLHPPQPSPPSSGTVFKAGQPPR